MEETYKCETLGQNGWKIRVNESFCKKLMENGVLVGGPFLHEPMGVSVVTNGIIRYHVSMSIISSTKG